MSAEGTNSKVRTGPLVYRDVAINIGIRLVNEAIWHRDRCTWTGDSIQYVVDDWKVVHGTIDETLYAGTCGVARFLSLLWHATGQETFRATAQGAIRQTLYLAESGGLHKSYGLYNGLTGLAWSIIKMGKIFEEPSLVQEGLRIARRVSKDVTAQAQIAGLDIVDGLAGVLVGLLHIARGTHDKTLHEDCGIIARKISAMAVRGTTGLSWGQAEQGDGTGTPNLCGMAHGASGIAYAFLEYFSFTGRPEFHEIAMEAIRYERAWFNRTHSNWPDIRSPDDQALRSTERFAYPVHWCHGAAGIGLVRLRAYDLTRNPTMLAEAGAAIQAAITSVRKTSLASAQPDHAFAHQTNLSICHGLGSIIDLFTYAYQTLGVEEYLERARMIGDLGVELAEDNAGQWPCGVIRGGENPGLMLGLAGIGICYLRLSDPMTAPPVGLLVE